MRVTLAAVLLFLFLFVPLAGAQSKSNVYSNPECGMRFEVPAGWIVQPAEEPSGYRGEICSVDLRPATSKNKSQGPDEIGLSNISITTLNAGLDAAAHDASFEQRDGRWVMLGEGAQTDAKPIRSAHSVGVSGIASVRCYGAEGYIGICEAPQAVLSDRVHMAAILSAGPQAEDQFDAILKSFEFVAQPRSYSGDPNWQQVCEQALTQPLQPEAPKGPLLAAQLENCDERALYYGFGKIPFYAAALQCGWYERSHPKPSEANLFYGPGVLSMLYANGLGVPRNYDLAIRFACEDKWTGGTEQELRIGHLEHLRALKLAPKNFDLCDDVTSGLNQGACADVAAARADASRAAKLKAISGTLTPEAAVLFDQLQHAEGAFETSRANTEVDLTGTARWMLRTNDRTRLRDQFLINLQRFAKGDVPPASKQDVLKLERELNAVYHRIEDAPADAWKSSTIRPEGIRQTERTWIELADAWMKFAEVAYPKVSLERVRAQLIRLRLHQLRALAPRD